MSDLKVVATIAAKPGSEQIVRDGLSTLAAASRGEDGCLGYELYESSAAPGTFVTVEVWTGQEALQAHMATPHLQAALGTFGSHLAGAPQIHPLTPIEV
ncbi:putative quinol monooxygenase [Rhodococcus sp. UNC363MFTsu5.1]|uniref:putative quinol monooxygenase n=1 Tax=Rhodococcus sp. UNC363MFTsu5.1 TaxID=1449069 RepID=UPI000480882B|nr:putative quinol monooxygenase [Rhodococcus sp. UNC363MFTsu5.1]